MMTVKKVGSVFAGFLTVVVLSVGTDALLESAGVFPSLSEKIPLDTWMLALAFVYRSVYAVAGGYVTAALSPERSNKQVMALAILGTAGGIGGIIYGWSMADQYGWSMFDLWYPIALAVTAYPLTTLGGRMRIKKLVQ